MYPVLDVVQVAMELMELHREHKCHAILQTYWVCNRLLVRNILFTYHRFLIDPSSPNYIEEDEEEEDMDSDEESDVDYEILSKIIQ